MFDWKRFAESAFDVSYDALHSEFYVPLALFRGRRIYPNAEETLQEELFRHRVNRILITGRPGSGKSFLLERLNGYFAERLLGDLENASGDLESASNLVVPIFVQLNLFDAEEYVNDGNELSLELKIREILSPFGLNVPFQEFTRSGPRFIFLIDDLDEVVDDNVSQNLREVRRFIEKYPDAKIILAGRESAANRFIHLFRTYKITDLSNAAVRSLLEQVLALSYPAPQLEKQVTEIWQYIEKPEGLLAFLSTPFFVYATADYWASPGSKEVNLGRLLFRVIEQLMYRQEKTEYSERAYALLTRRVFELEKLALETLPSDGIISKGQIDQLSEQDLRWFQQMEFISRSPAEPRFVSKWIHAYFAAHFLTRNEEFTGFDGRRLFLQSIIEPLTPLKYATVLLLQDLTEEDYLSIFPANVDLAHQFPQREIDWLSWAFEQKVAEYVRERFGFSDIRLSYQPSYLQGGGEIDVYAEKEGNRRKEIWVIECKFRLPAYPKPLRQKDVKQLIRNVKAVDNFWSEVAPEMGLSKKVVGMLFTNGDDQCPDDIARIVRRNNIELFYVALPAHKFTSRATVNANLVKRIRV